MAAAKEDITVVADADATSLKTTTPQLADHGAAHMERMQRVWGRRGRLAVYGTLALAMVVYELDATTYATYFVYALSSFRRVSASSALAVAADLSFSLTKPVWAKMSDIFGRGELYPVATLFVVAGYALAAAGTGVGAFAAGTVLRCIGLTGINTLNTIVIADTTSSRQRGFGVNFQFFPYLVLPWVAAEIVSSVVGVGGIGWRWGIGITGILFPVVMAPLIAVMLVLGRRVRSDHVTPHVTASSIASNIDLGGLLLLIASLACILLPLSLAGVQPDGYRTPWVAALMPLGGVGLLVAFPLYEQRLATHPFLPLRYLRNRPVLLAFLLYLSDYMAAAASHGYLYNWALVAHNLSVVQATNLSYMNSVFTFLVGMLFGLVMWRTRRYKWWLMSGCAVRLLGYGLMFRVRTTRPSLAELFVVQALQGSGNGIVQTGGYIAATINVPHRETAQMVALVVTIGMLGQSIGSAVSGAIYTGAFPAQLRARLGDLATPDLVNDLVNAIDLNLPAWGTPARAAIAEAYNHVTAYFFIAAIVLCAPGFVLVYLLPNQKLNDQQNLLETDGAEADEAQRPAKPRTGT